MSEEMEDLNDSPYEDLNEDDSWAPVNTEFAVEDPRRFQVMLQSSKALESTTANPTGIQQQSYDSPQAPLTVSSMM
jgi:hypothetical protein